MESILVLYPGMLLPFISEATYDRALISFLRKKFIDLAFERVNNSGDFEFMDSLESWVFKSVNIE